MRHTQCYPAFIPYAYVSYTICYSLLLFVGFQEIKEA
jgi:hypothetical protein